jgi:hypothetical protein
LLAGFLQCKFALKHCLALLCVTVISHVWQSSWQCEPCAHLPYACLLPCVASCDNRLLQTCITLIQHNGLRLYADLAG